MKYIYELITALFMVMGMLNVDATGGNEIAPGYYAVLHGGVGERTYETYVYRTDEGYSYVNVISTTVSWGSPQWKHEVKKRGKADSREKIAEIAKKHGASQFMTYAWDTKTAHTIEEFLDGVPELSDHYLIGFVYGRNEGPNPYWRLGAEVIITKEREAIIIMPTSMNGSFGADEKEIARVKLTKEQYQSIENAIDAEMVFMMDPGMDERICDGRQLELMLYDKQDRLLRKCGGYEPTNPNFLELYDTIFENVPLEEISAIVAEQTMRLSGEIDE